MRVPRAYIGKIVSLKWVDPIGGDRYAIEKAPKGLKALATWVEFGRIDNIEEEVVRLRHSEGYDPGEEKPGEGMYGYVHEALITEITVLEPEKQKEME